MSAVRRILHIITDLDNGGAEGVLYRLVCADKENAHEVISLMGSGLYGDRLSAIGVSVHTLDMRRGRLTLRGLINLYRLIRSIEADVVQTWMYHADLLGGAVGRLAGGRAVVWGIRHSNLDSDKTSASTRLAAHACAWLSGLVPAKIISCSEEAARVHGALGYRTGKMITVANGYDLREFAPDADARGRLRSEWGVAQNEVLLGMVARWNPQKDHINLIIALRKLAETSLPVWRCVLIGPGMDEANQALVGLLERHGVRDRIDLLGSRTDIPAVMNALDLHILASAGEAFPNVIAEAMACGTPVVSTDVGDAALIVGDTGWVVRTSDSFALAESVRDAILAMADAEAWIERKARCRARIVEHFSLERMVESYRSVWRGLAEGAST